MKRITRSSSRPKEVLAPAAPEDSSKKSTKSKAPAKKAAKVDEVEEHEMAEFPSADEGKTVGKKAPAGKKKVEETPVEPAKKSTVGKKRAAAPSKKPKSDDDDVQQDEEEASSPAKKTKGTSKKTSAPAKKAKSSEEEGDSATDDEAQQDEEMPQEDSPVKKSSKAKKPAAAAGKKAKPAKSSGDEADAANSPTKKNNTSTDYSKIQFESDENFNFKIATWNVAGLRALAKKNSDYIQQENPDIICFNEIKCEESEIPEEYKPEGYHAYWNIGKGFGGVGMLTKTKPISIVNDLPDSEFSDEKRMITAEFEKFYLISVYVVNSGRGLKTLDKRLAFNDVFDNHVKTLDKKKPVIIAGDMNVSHQEIDLANPKTNKRNAGFTEEERDGFTKLLSYGFVDTFRQLYPEKEKAYTFWTYMGNARSKNVGWRLDYFLVSQRFTKHVKDNVIRTEVMGSDHCPIVLLLSL